MILVWKFCTTNTMTEQQPVWRTSLKPEHILTFYICVSVRLSLNGPGILRIIPDPANRNPGQFFCILVFNIMILVWPSSKIAALQSPQ